MYIYSISKAITQPLPVETHKLYNEFFHIQCCELLLGKRNSKIVIETF